MFKKFKFKKYFLTTLFVIITLFANNLLFSLDIAKTNIHEQAQNELLNNELLNNKKLLNKIRINLKNTVPYISNYLNSIAELNNTKKEEQINKFIQESENKLSYYLKTSLIDGYISTTNNIKNKLIMSFIPMIPSIFKGGFLDKIEGLSKLTTQAFSMQTYSNWKFVAIFASQLAVAKLPAFLKLGASLGLNIASTKFLEIPYMTFNMAMIPLHGIIEIKNSLQRQYNTKQQFKTNILQRFYNLNSLLSQLKELSQIIESNETLKPLVKNIKKLVNYNQDDSLGNFLNLIKKVENYEKYKDKEHIQTLYKTYISIFIKMENHKYKNLINKALKDFEQIASLLPKVQAI